MVIYRFAPATSPVFQGQYNLGLKSIPVPAKVNAESYQYIIAILDDMARMFALKTP